MTQQSEAREQYVVPRYRETTSPAWYHVLHGAVPGHQIDFIYCPEVPQGPLSQTHLAHVARLVKYIEPRDQTSFAFALGNLSRDDVQHEPGHGGLALIFGLRVEGVIDHASRTMPPYAHGILAIDRALDYGVLLDAISTFYRRFLDEGASEGTGGFYRTYFQAMHEQPAAVPGFLRAYVQDFGDLPQPARSNLGADFVAQGTPPQRVTIVHADDEPFSGVAPVAAALGSMLYRSNVKWTSISNGREMDIPGGISVRLIPESEVPQASKGLVLRLDEVPTDDAEIAQQLFGAQPRETGAVRRLGWREQIAARKGAVQAPVSAPEHAGGRGVSRSTGRFFREPVRESEPVRKRESEPAQEREAAHLVARAPESVREREASAHVTAGLAVTAPEAVVSDAPAPGVPGPAAPAVAHDPLSSSAGAIAAALVQGVSPGEEAGETAALPPPVEPGPPAAPEVDDAAKTLAAPMRFEPDPTVDDAAATLTAPLRPAEAEASTLVEAPPPALMANGVVAGAAPSVMNTESAPAVARGETGAETRLPVPTTNTGVLGAAAPVMNAASAPVVARGVAGTETSDEIAPAATGKGKWIAIGAAVIAAAVVAVVVAGEIGSPEDEKGRPPATAMTPSVPSPATPASGPAAAPAAPDAATGARATATATVPGRAPTGDRGGTTVTAPASSPGAASVGGEGAGPGSTVHGSSGAGGPRTSGTGSESPPPASSPAGTTPKPATTKTKTKTNKLDDTNL